MWDEHNPVHFVGHSAGAQVVRVLHQMLADKVHTREKIFCSTHKSLLFVDGVVVQSLMPIMCFKRGGSCDLEYMIRAPNLR